MYRDQNWSMVKDGSEATGRFYCFDDSMVNFDGPCRLELTFESSKLTASGSDFFAALDAIRRQLEPSGVVPKMNGAVRNCYPSGMARDMGMGLSVYRLRFGVPASREDLVKTFEFNALGDLSMVDEQKRFYQE